MRISTVTMYEQSSASINRQQSDFLKVSQQLASGRRVVNPSDDPQAASRSVGVAQSMAMTEQFTDSRVSARNSLSQTESILNSVSDSITSAKGLMIQASNDTLSATDRESIASELRGVYETLIGQANSADGNGRYLFGGYADDKPPFEKNESGGVSYVGGTENREQRIDSSRRMQVTMTGDEIFKQATNSAKETGAAPDLFRTIEDALSVLESPTTPGEELHSTLKASMNELDNALDNVLTKRASAGARLNELDVVDSVASNRMLNYTQTMSDLVDLDMVEAISEYSMRQVGMQAAQRTFVDMSSMSLFDYL
ncbi:flagellar hook-associated protein FlgL [Vreelandella sp. GE22]